MSSNRGLEPGDFAADFELPNANSDFQKDIYNAIEYGPPHKVTLDETIGKLGGVIMFTCNHCPYVIANEERIELIAIKCRESGLGFVGINSNDPIVYPSDDWDHMKIRATEMSYPYLHDSVQTIAHAYGAERTPEFYLVNGEKTVIYRGRLDDSPRDPSKATTSELDDAITSLLNGKPISIPRTESIGCSVKWKE